MEEKIKKLKLEFQNCPDAESRYRRIIELGRAAPSLDPKYKILENRVSGCQSQLYLRTTVSEGHVSFQAEADALISNGLAAILIYVYSGEPAEAIVKHQPRFLEELGITASLSPSRANGLGSLHLRMRQEALRALTGARR